MIRICEAIQGEDSEVALRLIRELVPAAPPNEERKGGNSGTYLLCRLKRDRPDLAERMVNREISVHAAVVEAASVPRMIQHPPTVDGFARAIDKHLSREEKKKLGRAYDISGLLHATVISGPNRPL